MNQSNLVQEILSIKSILQNNTIGIVLGEKVSIDTAAAALGIYLSLKEAGKNPQIISKKDPIVEIANLVGINKIGKSFSGNSNKVVVSLPYNRGEIGKVSYKEENGRINFHLTATEGKSITAYEANDINLIWDGAMPSVIITFGVESLNQLSEFTGVDEKSTRIINIDNSEESFGEISIIGNSFSSVSEIVVKIIKELNLPLNIDIAQNLLDGILYGTRNFTKSNTSSYAFESAGILMQYGAVRVDNRNTNTNREATENQNRSSHQTGSQNRNQRHQSRSGNQMSSNRNQGQHINQNRDRSDEAHKATPRAEKSVTEVSPSRGDIPLSQAQDDKDVPNDWLTPKVFKGSQNIDNLK